MIPPGPHDFDGLWLTFSSWVDVEGADRSRGTPRSWASPCGTCTRRWRDYPGELATMLDLLADIERLRAAPPARAREADSLGDRLHALTDSVFDTTLPTQPLHGDASLSNLLRTPLGLLWNDFEDVLRGPRPLGRGGLRDGPGRTPAPTPPSSAERSTPTAGTTRRTWCRSPRRTRSTARSGGCTGRGSRVAGASRPGKPAPEGKGREASRREGRLGHGPGRL